MEYVTDTLDINNITDSQMDDLLARVATVPDCLFVLLGNTESVERFESISYTMPGTGITITADMDRTTLVFRVTVKSGDKENYMLCQLDEEEGTVSPARASDDLFLLYNSMLLFDSYKKDIRKAVEGFTY